MPKKSRYTKKEKIIKSDDEQEEEEQEPIYFKSKYNKVQALKIQQLTQDFLKNNIIEFHYYK